MSTSAGSPRPDFDIVPWNSSFETGVGLIDEQHRHLVDLINDLARQYVRGLDPGGAQRIVGALADYTAYHFDAEEALWAEALQDDQWAVAHRRAHQGFVDKVRGLQADLSRHEALPALDDLLSFLTRWLAHHILYDDKRMATALLAVRQGVGVGGAKQHAVEAMSGQASVLIQSVLSMYELLSTRTLALERETFARHRAEQALREQDERWEAAVGVSRDTLWDCDLREVALPEPGHVDHWSLPAGMAFLEDGEQRIHAEDWPRLRSHLLAHLLGHGEAFSDQYRVVDAQGGVRWLQSRGKVVARDTGGRPLRMVGTQTDISERKTAELALQRERDTRTIISDFAADFMASSLGDFDAAIRRALERSGTYLQADRSYVFLLTGDGEYMNNTHEWCAPGIRPKIDHLQGIPADATPWWWAQLRDPGYVLVRRVADMPPEAHAEQAILQAQDIQSVCVHPLRAGGRIVGFLGNDSVLRERQWGADVLHFLSLMSDLLGIALEHRQVHQQRAQALHRLERAEQQAHLGHWTLDPASGRATWSAEVFRILERSPGSVVPSHEAYLESVHPEDRQAVHQALEQAQASLGRMHVEHRVLLEGGRQKHVEVRGQFSAGEEGRAALIEGTVQDVSDKARHQEELQRLAFQDPLTGLPNRRALEETLRREMQHAQRHGEVLAMALVDLDNFREATERFGPALGDRLLLALSQRMRVLFDQPGAVSRVGGDEFVVLFTRLQQPKAHVVQVKRLLAAINEPLSIDGVELAIGASVGVTEFPQPMAVSGDQLLRQAQQALFDAKLHGKNRYHLYDATWEKDTRVLAERLDEIQAALRGDEFVLHYQPKVNMRTGVVIGAEALIRWQKPSGQLLGPADFLPIVQDHPLEVALGDWVIEAALTQMRAWQAQGLHLQISVNVSSLQLLDDAFVDKLQALLSEFPDVAPAALQLEILESSALQDIARVSRIMQRCRELGVSFALDDFGTGFSSLAYLKHLPASVLKIDQGFVRDMLASPDDLSIISGVVGMAKAFGLQVIAEGVETVEHGELLLHLGCEQAQGYGIARPMPAAALPGWIAGWKPEPSWRAQPAIDVRDMPLLHAMVEHRGWLLRLEQWLCGHSERAPLMDHRQCGLAHWMNGDGRSHTIHRPEYQRLFRLHREVHQLGHDALSARGQGRMDSALALLPRLRSQCEGLVAELRALLRRAQR